jgi:beta-N-acetylhexosaminidase
MGAVYGRNICTAVVEALNAGVDLLLVAFDSDQFYRIFTCASEAVAQNKLDLDALRASDVRLERSLMKPEPPPVTTPPAEAQPAGK